MGGQVGKTDHPDPMMRGDAPATSNGWTVTPIFTVGETLKSQGTQRGHTPAGILDGTHRFQTEPGELLLIGDVQAHSITDGIIADEGLVQGAQLIFLSTVAGKSDGDDDGDWDNGNRRNDKRSSTSQEPPAACGQDDRKAGRL